MLSERTPGELFDDPIRLKRLWEPEDCWKCGAKIGELHDPGCSFDFCRRSGIQTFGERPCFCDMGPQYNYLTGERINAKKTNAGRIDPPGTLAKPHDGRDDGGEICQFDVPWDGYAPMTNGLKALGIVIVRRVATDPETGRNCVVNEFTDDWTAPGAMADSMSEIMLRDSGGFIWNSLLCRFTWSDKITSLENSSRALARLALLSAKDRGAPREDAPKAMHVVHRLAASGHATTISSVLAFFKGEEKPWFYGGMDKIFEASRAAEGRTESDETDEDSDETDEDERAVPARADLRGMKIKELKALVERGGLSHADCLDKDALVERAAAAVARLGGAGEASDESEDLSVD